jgi:hypothetical protein
VADKKGEEGKRSLGVKCRTKGEQEQVLIHF